MKAQKYPDVHVEDKQENETILTGCDLLDDFWSTDRGFTCASTILLTGTSGSGKTTLAHFIQQLLKSVKTYLYSREMLAKTIKKQMRRNAICHQNAHVADRTTIAHFDEFLKDLYEVNPKVLIIDSIQVILDQDFENISEEKATLYIVQKIRQWAEDTNGVAIVIGQLNKEGVEAGSAKLKFLLDAHLEMTYDKRKEERFIEWSKNRFGMPGKLFYIFNDEGIRFYTPSQWIATKEKLELTDFINKAIRSYISLIKIDSPNFKTFKKEYNKEIDKIFEQGCRGVNLSIKAIQLIQQYIVKHDIKTY